MRAIAPPGMEGGSMRHFVPPVAILGFPASIETKGNRPPHAEAAAAARCLGAMNVLHVASCHYLQLILLL